MSRDIDKNVALYFFDTITGIWTGEVGNAGDSEDFALPVGMTAVVPSQMPGDGEQIRWDGSAWILESDNEYDNLSQAEKDIWDAQIAINQAQHLVDETMGDYLNKLSGFMLNRWTVAQSDYDYINDATTIAQVQTALIGILDKIALTQTDITFLEDFRTKYAAWIALKD